MRASAGIEAGSTVTPSDQSSAVEEDWTQLHNGVKLIEACGKVCPALSY